MLKGTTKHGFEFKIKEQALDDWEIMEILDELEENPQKLVSLLRLVLGAKQYEDLKKHLLKKHKKIKVEIMTDEFNSIMEVSKEVSKDIKN